MLLILPKIQIATKWYTIDNRAYRKHGWLGCQLESYQFRKPKWNERRILSDMNMKEQWEIEIYNYHREGLFISCQWRLINAFMNLDQYSKKIRDLYTDLDRL